MQQTSASSDDQRIRETAYHLWEKDGRPFGQAERHWQLALRLAAEPAAESAPAPKKKRAPTKPRRAAEA